MYIYIYIYIYVYMNLNLNFINNITEWQLEAELYSVI